MRSRNFGSPSITRIKPCVCNDCGSELARIAKRHGRTVSQIVFRFAVNAGMVPLTGTSDPAHMRADLEVFDFHLEPEEVKQIEALAGS